VHGSVTAEQIGKAYEYSHDCRVELSDEELAQLVPADDKTITLERFFPGDQLDLTLLAGRSLFLSPANLAAHDAFAVVRTALSRKRTWALGRTVFSQRRTLVVVHPVEETLLLHTLHDPGMRRAPVSINANGKSPSRTDLRAVTEVIDKASGPFDLTSHEDDFAQRLASLIRGKMVGSKIRRGKRTTVKRNTNGRPPARKRRPAKAA
jgi:DNA end-binding protein Ku